MNPPKALNAVRIVDGKVVVIRPGETDPCLASSGRTGFANPVLVSSNSALEIDPTDALFPLFELGKASSNVQLLKSVRRSTLLWRLERDSPDKVWKDLLKAQEVFEIRAAKASSFNIQRVLARFQCGMCQQRGFDKDGRPLVWIFAGLEEYSREYQSEEKQIEYSHTLLVLAEYALRYRRQGVEDITVIVDSRGIAPLNFGAAVARALVNNLPALFDCLRSVVYVDGGFAARAFIKILKALIGNKFPIELRCAKDRTEIEELVSNPDTDIPPQFYDLYCEDETHDVSRELEICYEHMCGLRPPASIADIHNRTS